MLLQETKSNWYLVTSGHQIKVNTSMEKYTARQYAEMAGGHTMSEDKPASFGFVKDLNESRMFRTRQRLEGTNARDMADFAFLNMLSLYILYNEYDFKPAASDIARRTMQYGNFNAYRQSSTDLYQSLHSIKTGLNDLSAKDKMQLKSINFPDIQIKQFLNQMKTGRPIMGAPGFFLKLERGLDIQNSNYRSIRRLAQDWPQLNQMQKSLVITRLNQYYRAKALRSEMYSMIRDIGRSQGLMFKNANNAEKPKMRGSDTLSKLAKFGVATAAGYALGKAYGRSLMAPEKE